MSEQFKAGSGLHLGRNYHTPLLNSSKPLVEESSRSFSKPFPYSPAVEASAFRHHSGYKDSSSSSEAYSSRIFEDRHPTVPLFSQPGGLSHFHSHNAQSMPVDHRASFSNHASPYPLHSHSLPPINDFTLPSQPIVERKPSLSYSFANLLHPSHSPSLASRYESERSPAPKMSCPMEDKDGLDSVLPPVQANRGPKRAALSKPNLLEANQSPIGTKFNESKVTTGYQCDVCQKTYKQQGCLAKHLWEHNPNWKEVSKLSLPKSQQVQLMEAAQILVDISRSQPIVKSSG